MAVGMTEGDGVVRRVAVLGAGHGGCAAAADLMLRGFKVRLHARSAARLAPLLARGGIEAHGVQTGFVTPEVMTTDLAEAIAGADLIMLDNMSVSEMALAVRTVRGRALLEASGNVRLDTVRAIAETGVDFISTSAVIHSSRWSDLSLLFDI